MVMYNIAFCENNKANLVMQVENLCDLQRFCGLFDTPHVYVNFTDVKYKEIGKQWILVGFFDIYEPMNYIPLTIHLLASTQNVLPSEKEISAIISKKKFTYAEVKLIPVKCQNEMGKNQI